MATDKNDSSVAQTVQEIEFEWVSLEHLYRDMQRAWLEDCDGVEFREFFVLFVRGISIPLQECAQKSCLLDAQRLLWLALGSLDASQVDETWEQWTPAVIRHCISSLVRDLQDHAQFGDCPAAEHIE
mmetsp:Transcript_16529/g.33785  ORF Transcript_16529/g.33785 Transcript_16529/m.33785 type:complete len:127 (-) Transcript_16529:2040-2420(-)